MNEHEIARERVNADKYEQPAYLLWLLREGVAKNWQEFYHHFGLQPSRTGTIGIILEQTLKSLQRARLIELPNGDDFWASEESAESPILVTDTVSQVFGALSISLAEHAQNAPRRSIRVSPIFGRPFDDKYAHDLFVLMPFSQDLAPIYEDHIKKIAKSLDMSVARANDFFTQEPHCGLRPNLVPGTPRTTQVRATGLNTSRNSRDKRFMLWISVTVGQYSGRPLSL